MKKERGLRSHPVKARASWPESATVRVLATQWAWVMGLETLRASAD
jgi:hypothetical protein